MARNPFEEIEEMLEDVSRQFEEGGIGPSASPPVDVRDEGDRFVVVADLPGYDAEDVELQLSGRRLEIAAERTTETESGSEEFVRRERTRTSVDRSVQLPEDVDESAVSASLDAGVLTVELPKRERDAGREIEIED